MSAAEVYAARSTEFAETLREQDEGGDDPDEVAELIEKVLESPDPGARYPVGLPPQIATRARALIPDRIFDAVATRPLKP